MQTLADVFRTTFPRHLRFDPACQILYAQCYSVSRQHKHKKYIPKAAIEDILNGYERLPGSPWLQLPVIRHVLLIRIVNGVRQYYGRPSWLYNQAVEAEYTKLSNWMEKQNRAVKTTGTSRASSVILREQFDKEVLGEFHVATMYQRMARFFVVFACVLIVLLIAAINTDAMVYLYTRFWLRLSREDVLQLFRDVTARHTVTDIPLGYESLLPSPCTPYTNEQGEAGYAVNIAELVSEDKGITVIAVPCPLVGTRQFFTDVGDLAMACDAVLMEGVPMEKMDRMPPVAFFPLKDETFPALGLHHRYLDILRGQDVPPMLYPAGSNLSWVVRWKQFISPFEVRSVYQPTTLSGTKGEARVGWGHLRELIDRVATENTNRSRGGPHKVICVPWTVFQIANLEASLVKYGFEVKRVFPMHWLGQDHMGSHFCQYYNITR